MSKTYEGFDTRDPTVIVARFRTRKEAQSWRLSGMYVGEERDNSHALTSTERMLFLTHEAAVAWRRKDYEHRRFHYVEPPAGRSFRQAARPACSHADCRENPDIMAACADYQKSSKAAASRPEKRGK